MTDDDDAAHDGSDYSRDSAETRRGLLRAAAGTSVAVTTGTAGCLSITTPADISARNEVQGNVNYLVGPDWLAANRETVVVLDARDGDRFRQARIYRARHVPIDDITAQAGTENGAVPDTETLAETFGDIGVSRDDNVVVYGASVGSRVTRVAYTLSALGHDGDIRVLNGGFDGWNGRVGTGSRDQVAATGYEPAPDEQTWITREWLADRLGSVADDGYRLIDTRVPEAYLAAPGSDAINPDHDRHGHLPGAINIHWIGNVAGRQMADPGRLTQLYENEAGIDRSETIVLYGDGNVDPTSTWLTLRAIGFTDVRLYDGGFREWANVDGDRGRYPVETSTNVVIETDGSVGGDDSGGDFSCTG